MKNRVTYLFALCSIFFLSGCFEIVEQVTLKADGSGQFTWIANLSQSKDNLKGIMSQDSIMGKPVPQVSDISAKMDEAKNILAGMQGISGVVVEKDFDNFLFKVSCNFSNMAALDEALAGTLEKMAKNKEVSIPRGNFTYSQGKFKRTIAYDYSYELGKVNEQTKDILSKASFMAIYRFDKEVSSASNSLTKISPSKKATMLKVDAWKAMKEKAIENEISLKN